MNTFIFKQLDEQSQDLQSISSNTKETFQNRKSMKLLVRKPEIDIDKRNYQVNKKRSHKNKLEQFAGFFSPTHYSSNSITSQKKISGIFNEKKNNQNLTSICDQFKNKEPNSPQQYQQSTQTTDILSPAQSPKLFERNSFLTEKSILNCSSKISLEQKNIFIKRFSDEEQQIKDENKKQDRQFIKLKTKNKKLQDQIYLLNQNLENCNKKIRNIEANQKKLLQKIEQLQQILQQEILQNNTLKQSQENKKDIIKQLEYKLLKIKDKADFYNQNYLTQKQLCRSLKQQNIYLRNSVLKQLELKNQELMRRLQKSKQGIKYLQAQIWVERKKKYEDLNKRNIVIQSQKKCLIEKNKSLKISNIQLKQKLAHLSNKFKYKQDQLFELSPDNSERSFKNK